MIFDIDQIYFLKIMIQWKHLCKNINKFYFMIVIKCSLNHYGWWERSPELCWYSNKSSAFLLTTCQNKLLLSLQWWVFLTISSYRHSLFYFYMHIFHCRCFSCHGNITHIKFIHGATIFTTSWFSLQVWLYVMVWRNIYISC